MAVNTQTRGFYGWWLLLFLWIVYTIPVGFVFYSPAVLYPFMIEEMGWSRGEIMVGATAVMLLFGLSGPLAAWMLRRFGARATLSIGGGIVVLATSLMGLLGDVYGLYLVLALFIGLGVALGSMIPVQTVVVSWFNARRALAMGLVLGGGAIGGFLAPQLVSAAVQEAGGNWRIGWFVIAAATIIGTVVAMLAVRNQPADMGQHPDGLSADEAKVAAGINKAAKTYRTSVNWSVRDALRTSAFWFLMLAVNGSFFLWQIIVTQGPLHLQDRGFDPAMAAFFYSLAIGLSIMGRFTIAALGDIIEPRYLFGFGAFCILLGGILFWFASPDAVWAAYLYPLLAGFGFGAAYICIPTITGNYWGPATFAALSGLISPITLSLQAIAAPLAGFLYDLQGSYFTIMLLSWVGAAIGFVAILLCTPPKLKADTSIKDSSD